MVEYSPTTPKGIEKENNKQVFSLPLVKEQRNLAMNYPSTW